MDTVSATGYAANRNQVRHRRREQERIDDIEHAAEAGDRLRRVLRLQVALDQRFGQVAKNPSQSNR